jgi:Xylose isomerase-like TIM barrel
MFPSVESADRRFASLDRVLQGEFPCFIGTIKALRLTAIHPAALRYPQSPIRPGHGDIDFNFQIARALGCKAITIERNDQIAKRLAPFAEKHKIWVAFHNHTNNVPTIESIDPLMQIGNYIGFNFDIGHYVAGTQGKSPIPVIEKYHDKIISLHLKDRDAGGGNLPWGEGQTPIKEVLQLLKKEKWPIYADIELEYKVPQDSTSVAEVAKCVQFCKEALA